MKIGTKVLVTPPEPFVAVVKGSRAGRVWLRGQRGEGPILIPERWASEDLPKPHPEESEEE